MDAKDLEDFGILEGRRTTRWKKLGFLNKLCGAEPERAERLILGCVV